MAHTAFERKDHRPWPCPDRRWSWRQTWRDLLFVHWRVPADQLRPHIPSGLELETFDGECWIGVVPFRMSASRRWLPLPNHFRELNVRTYVTRDQKPGIWFFSLDATDALAVWFARRWFGLPYWLASIRMVKDGSRISFESTRRHDGPTLRTQYGPIGDVFEAEPGTLDHWLTERYCLYSVSRKGVLKRTDVHHQPWPLQPGHAAIQKNTMMEPFGIVLPDEMPVVHFARRLDVVVWSATACATASS